MPDRGYMLVSGLVAGRGHVSEHDLGFRVATVMAILKPGEVSSLAKSRMAGDGFALEVVLWEGWVSTTLPFLARNYGIAMVEGEELSDFLSQHYSRSTNRCHELHGTSEGGSSPELPHDAVRAFRNRGCGLCILLR